MEVALTKHFSLLTVPEVKGKGSILKQYKIPRNYNTRNQSQAVICCNVLDLYFKDVVIIKFVKGGEGGNQINNREFNQLR